MANASDYLEQQIYNHIFRNDTFAKPPNIFIGLTLDVPQDDGTYTEVPDANAYARYAVVSGDARWVAMAADGAGTNAVDFEFAAANGGSWGTVSGVIICDSGHWGGGNVLLHGELTSAKTVDDGDTFKFSAGALDLTIA